MRTAKRIEKLPPYLFAEIDRKVDEARARGADIISFGVGDPDMPTPPHIVEALTEAVRDARVPLVTASVVVDEFDRLAPRLADGAEGPVLDGLVVAVAAQLVLGGLGAVWIIGPATARLGFARYATLAAAGVSITLFGHLATASIGLLMALLFVAAATWLGSAVGPRRG